MKTLSATIEIDAPAAVVWEVLTDTAAYPSWNPFITRLAGSLTVGRRLTVRIQPPGGRPMTFRPTVTIADDERRLEWLGHLGVPGIFDGRHAFVLEPLPGRRTRLVQSETFTGVLVSLTGGTLARTAKGFAAMNEELKARAEVRAAADDGATPAPAATSTSAAPTGGRDLQR